MARKKKTTTRGRNSTTLKTANKAVPTKRYRFSKVEKARTKSDVFTNISENTGISKKDVNEVFGCLSAMIQNDLKSGPQAFTIPGLSKIVVQRKPATKARKGINPFTGEEMMFKAKPARNIVKVRPLKALKEMV